MSPILDHYSSTTYQTITVNGWNKGGQTVGMKPEKEVTKVDRRALHGSFLGGCGSDEGG